MHGIIADMLERLCIIALVASLAGCAAQPAPKALFIPTAVRPLEVLPGEASLAMARTDLIATARARFGAAVVDRAMASPVHLMVKRFAGMAPPPPPGAGPDWRPPTPAALLVRDSSGWAVATTTGWRPANAEPAAEVDRLLADEGFWREPAFTPACPDYGAALLLLKVPRRAETVRNSQCTSRGDHLVSVALTA